MSTNQARFNFVPNFAWLHVAWRHKMTVLAGTLAVLSMSLAHYAGFLLNVPLPLVALAGVSLAPGVTATFLFYVFFSAVSARVFASIFHFFLLLYLSISDRLEGGFRLKMDWRGQRRFVRSHNRTIKWEGLVGFVTQTVIAVFFMLGIYVKFNITSIAVASLAVVLVISMIASGLIRAGFFLQPRRKPFIHKLRNRPTRKGRAAAALFVTTTAVLVIAAFFLGLMRSNLLHNQRPYIIVSKNFSGVASVIASTEGAILLYQKEGIDFRYIYLTPEFTTSMETKPVFKKLGTEPK